MDKGQTVPAMHAVNDGGEVEPQQAEHNEKVEKPAPEPQLPVVIASKEEKDSPAQKKGLHLALHSWGKKTAPKLPCCCGNRR